MIYFPVHIFYTIYSVRKQYCYICSNGNNTAEIFFHMKLLFRDTSTVRFYELIAIQKKWRKLKLFIINMNDRRCRNILRRRQPNDTNYNIPLQANMLVLSICYGVLTHKKKYVRVITRAQKIKMCVLICCCILTLPSLNIFSNKDMNMSTNFFEC